MPSLVHSLPLLEGPIRRNGGTFRGGSISGGGVTDAAGVTRDQWQHFLEVYRPVEQEALRSALQTDFTEEGNEAGRLAEAGVTAARGSLARTLSRQGTSLSGEERSALARRTRSTLSRSVARAENTTRRELSDSRTNLLASLVGIGRGVSQTASGGLQSAADMAAQREAVFRNQRAQHQANLTSGLSTAAALAIAFI